MILWKSFCLRGKLKALMNFASVTGSLLPAHYVGMCSIKLQPKSIRSLWLGVSISTMETIDFWKIDFSKLFLAIVFMWSSKLCICLWVISAEKYRLAVLATEDSHKDYNAHGAVVSTTTAASMIAISFLCLSTQK